MRERRDLPGYDPVPASPLTAKRSKGKNRNQPGWVRLFWARRESGSFDAAEVGTARSWLRYDAERPRAIHFLHAEFGGIAVVLAKPHPAPCDMARSDGEKASVAELELLVEAARVADDGHGLAAFSARTLSTRACCSPSVEGRGIVGEKRNGPGDRPPRAVLERAGSRFRDPA